MTSDSIIRENPKSSSEFLRSDVFYVGSWVFLACIVLSKPSPKIIPADRFSLVAVEGIKHLMPFSRIFWKVREFLEMTS